MTNYTGTPEQLKIIAEAMGYDAAYICKERVYYDGAFDSVNEYNPSTNAEQREEIEDYLLGTTVELTIIRIGKNYYLRLYEDNDFIEGKNRAEVALSAIWKVVK